MSLDQSIKHRKEHRQPYRGAARVDKSCRNHGGGNAHPCPYCTRNRTIQSKKLDAQARLAAE